MTHERVYTSRQTVELEIRAFLKTLRSDGSESLRFLGSRSELLPTNFTDDQVKELQKEIDVFLMHLKSKLSKVVT